MVFHDFRLVIHSFRWVFMFFHDSWLIFHDFRLVIHSSRSVFMFFFISGSFFMGGFL